LKIAIVYDRINKFGGAERILLALHEIWPEAPIFTAVYSPKTASWASDLEIKTSFLQYVPFASRHHEWFPWLTPIAFERFDFSGYDVVLSVTSAEAKYCIKTSKPLHICYCLTPTRYLWSHKKFYEQDGVKGKFLSILGPPLRMKDYLAAQKIDRYLAISKTVSKRIKKYYNKDSKVIYPPADFPDIGKFNDENQSNENISAIDESFYLVVSRLVPYKRIDLAITACNKLRKQLVIVGKGSEEKRLKKIAGKTITFTGELTDIELNGYYMQCKAVIFPSEEDFGIVPVEAQRYGKPVVAFGVGGASETVLDGKTGVLFYKQDDEALKEAILKLEALDINKSDCKQNASKFSKKRFKQEISSYISEAWKLYNNVIN
jgi:glycosyltransferase involved in cell wall biosynthesis